MIIFLIIIAVIGWAIAIAASILAGLALLAYASCLASANEIQKPLIQNNKWQKN